MKAFIYKVFALVIYFMLLTTFNKIRFRYDWSDAVKRTVMTPFTGTMWAEGFSEAKFAKIKLGMSKAEVKMLLGAPLNEWCGDNGCDWIYSWQDTQTSDYDRRWVSISNAGFVESVRHEFFID